MVQTKDASAATLDVAAATDTAFAASAADSAVRCQIMRTLDIVGEKWSLLIVRDALRGRTRFSEFRESLGAPSDILTTRLAKLVDAGVLEKRAYREPGSRERSSYHLTESGRGLALVVGALLQWGDTYNPYDGGKASLVVDATLHEEVSLAFIGPSGRPLATDEVTFVPGPAARSTW